MPLLNHISPFRDRDCPCSFWDSLFITLLQTSILDVGDFLKVKFHPDGSYKTIAGFMMTELGFVPVEGDQLKRFGYSFNILKHENLCIVEISVKCIAA